MADTRNRTSKAASGRGRASGTGKGQAGRPRRRWPRRVLVTLLTLFVVGTLAAGVGGVVLWSTTTMPDANRDFQTQTTFVYYNDGTTKMGNFAVQNRTVLPYDQIPQSIKDAVIAAENRSFWTDPGISVPGMARAALVALKGGDMQGGSTITQQYIKIMYLNSERTLARKLKEIVLAAKVGRDVPKEKILEGYLNTIYFGRGAYGIEAASKAYFNVPASKLSVAQSAVLASVLNNPSIFDPSGGTKNTARLLDRYRYVLAGMLEMNTITQAQYDAAAKALPAFPDVPTSNRYGGPTGYLMTMVESELADKGFSESQINGGGLRITTTFDKTLQDAAVASAQKYTREAADNAGKDPSELHAAIASVDTSTGAVLALYGGPDYVKYSRNWALTPRAAASTFKGYALAAGLRNGFTLNSQLNGNTFTPRGDSTPVRNEFGTQYGSVSLRRATQDSINTAFVDMTEQIPDGPQEVIKAANDAGVSAGPGWDPNNRIALGTAEVSPLDNAVGYATFANDGAFNPAHVVAKVTDASGKVLYQAKKAPSDKIGQAVASNVTAALEAVVDQGTGTRVRDLGHAAAGKTGTSGVGDAITSAWFVAYTKQISTAVMYVAGDDGTADLDPYKRPGDSAFFGGSYPAMTWLDYMKVAMKDLPDEDFTAPERLRPSKASPPERTADAQTQPSTSPSPTGTPTPTATPSAPESTPASPSATKEAPSADVTTAAPTPSATPRAPTITPREPTARPSRSPAGVGTPTGRSAAPGPNR